MAVESASHLVKDSGSFILASVLGGLIATYAFFSALLRLTHDRNEPELVATSIPFISPILGMYLPLDGAKYPYARDKHRTLPIFTLRVPGVRLYVINSTALIPVVQRQWQVLLFPPIQARAAETAMSGSKEAVAIIRRDMISNEGFVNGMMKATHSALSKGPELDELNANAIKAAGEALDQVASKGPTTIKLFDWISREMMWATTDGIYGPHNPMRDRKNYDAWEKYQPTLMFLLLDIFPRSFFAAGTRGRDHLAKSFAKYYAEGRYAEGSAYIKAWVKYVTSQGIPINDIGKFLVGSMFTVAANTIPTAFWVVYRIFSDPTVLNDCRNEVSRAVREQDGIRTIDASYVLNSCPILQSTYQEVFRIHGMGHSVRVASEDHMLDGKYLIKKGGILMISARAQHSDPEIWGKNAGDFDYKRFVKKPGAKGYHPVAFRGFGGGTTLCPGRHFATAEILLFTALLLLRFDLQPVGGRWPRPTAYKSSQAEAMEQPDNDISIELRPQQGAGQAWRISF